MRHFVLAMLGSIFLVQFGLADWRVAESDAAVPETVAEPIRKLLGKAQKVSHDTEMLTFWPRQSLPTVAVPEQIRNGLTYREFEAGLLVGVVRFAADWSDYRKKSVRAGVYTVRLAFQPMSDEHCGSAPHTEFLLLCPVEKDRDPAVVALDELIKRSRLANSLGEHPTTMLLYPYHKPDAAAKVVDRGKGVTTFQMRVDVQAESGKATLGLAMTILGHTTKD